MRQFDGPNVAITTEYMATGEAKIETRVILDINIYTKPLEGD